MMEDSLIIFNCDDDNLLKSFNVEIKLHELDPRVFKEATI